MRFLRPSLLPLLLLSFGSCGILGAKDAAKRSIAITEESGCLDELGNRMDAFIDGTIAESVWVDTWACVEDTLDKFEKLVRPSDSRGFTQADIQGLVRTFLVRKKPVTADFVQASFAAKASLFGGNAQIFSYDDLGKLRQVIQLIKTDTPSMIPLLRSRRENPTADRLRPLVKKIGAFGEHLAERLSPENNPTLSREMLMQFMSELAKMSLNGSPAEYQEWGSFLIDAKRIFVHGPEDGIAGADWKEMIRSGTELGAIVLGLGSVRSDEPEYELELVTEGRAAIDRILNRWNGKIPYALLEKAVATIPHSFLPARAEDFRVGVTCALRKRYPKVDAGSLCPAYPECPTGGCRPALARILSAKVDDAIDTASIDTLHDVYRTGTRAKIHLLQILSGIKEEVTPSQFADLADRYASGASPEVYIEVERLKRIAREYAGQFPEDSGEMEFSSLAGRSLNNIKLFSYYEAVAEKLLLAYGSRKNPLKGTIEDLYFVVKDWEMVLLSFSMVHPLKEKVHEKRFREANLFTIPGNGDTAMDVREAASYIATLMSTSKLSKRIQNDIFKDDPITGRKAPCRAVGTDSCLKLPQYNVQCFRDHFNSNLKEYWRNFPGLLADFEAMKDSERTDILKSYEAAAKLSGLYDETDVSAYDVDSYAGIPHFMEGLMKKFDNRGGREDGYLDRDEIDDQVWPTFETEFKKMTDLAFYLRWMNKPLFIYLLQHGGLPFVCQKAPQIGEIAKFAAWMATGGHKKSFKIRRSTMFKVFEELSKPILPNCKGYVPPGVCKGAETQSFLDDRGMELTTEMELMLLDSVSEAEKIELDL